MTRALTFACLAGLCCMTPSALGASRALSRAALARTANALCATAQRQSDAVAAPSGVGSGPNASAAYFAAIYPITDRETRAISALVPAPSAAAAWRAFVRAQVAADRLLLRLRQDARAGDGSALSVELGHVRTVGERVARTATRIGAATCADG